MESKHLTSDDTKYLQEHYPDQWEMRDEGGLVGLIIKNYLLPKGYQPEKANLMVIIPHDYPMAALDMFYLHPPVARQDGMGIGALCIENHFNMGWQRWSRHYSWKPGDHCLATHLAYIENALKFELKGQG